MYRNIGGPCGDSARDLTLLALPDLIHTHSDRSQCRSDGGQAAQRAPFHSLPSRHGQGHAMRPICGTITMRRKPGKRGSEPELGRGGEIVRGLSLSLGQVGECPGRSRLFVGQKKAVLAQSGVPFK